MTSGKTIVILALLVRLVSVHTRAEEQNDRAERLIEFTKSMESFSVKVGNDREQELTLIKKPILRYSDAVASDAFIEIPDGVMFVWTKDDYPAAISSVHLGTRGTHWTEFLSLTSDPLFAIRKNQTVWHPTSSGIEFKDFPEAPIPDESAAERMVQMRSLMKSFAASISDVSAGRQELRLLPKSLYRYSKSTKRVLDGAIFAFARGTNPEMLVLLEAQLDKDNNKRWRYSPARYTGREGQLICPAAHVWSHEAFRGARNPAESFFQVSVVPDSLIIQR